MDLDEDFRQSAVDIPEALLRLVHLLAYFALDISGFDHISTPGQAVNATDTTGASPSADYRLCEFVSPLYLSKTSRLVLACYIITHSQLILLWDLIGYIKTTARRRMWSPVPSTTSASSRRWPCC